MNALVLNVTMPSTFGGPSYLTVYPSNLGNPPMASNLNWTPGEVVANAVTIGMSETESVAFYSPNDFANLVVDLEGALGPAPSSSSS